MKILLTLLISAVAFSFLNAQTTQPENQQPATEQEPLKKASYDIVVPKRVVQMAPSTKTQNLSEIQKIQEEKKQDQPSNGNTETPANRVTSQDLENQELQKKQQEYEQLKKQPE